MSNITRYFADRQGTILVGALAFIMTLFIAILVMIYFVSKRANPVMLDERGQPINSQPAQR